MQSYGVCVWDGMWAGGIVHYFFGDNVDGADRFYNFKNFVYRILSLFKDFVSYMYIVYQGFYRIIIVYQFYIHRIF